MGTKCHGHRLHDPDLLSAVKIINHGSQLRSIFLYSVAEMGGKSMAGKRDSTEV